jgi:hypothetical protein
MKSFQGKYSNFNQRLLNINNFIYLIFFIFYTFISFRIDYYLLLIESLMFIILVYLIIRNSKTDIYKIDFNDDSIIYYGETFNTKWEESTKINNTRILLKGKPSRNICSREYYLEFISKEKKYYLNNLNTYSDEGILLIFNYFKEKKGEKIIYDEKFLIERVQNKINQCQ